MNKIAAALITKMNDSGLVHRVEPDPAEYDRYREKYNASLPEEPDYYKVITEFLLGISNDYLNVYLMYEEEIGWYLSDTNNIYAILDDYYELTEKMLRKAAEEAGLEFDNYGFYAMNITEENVVENLRRYQRAIELLTAR